MAASSAGCGRRPFFLPFFSTPTEAAAGLHTIPWTRLCCGRALGRVGGTAVRRCGRRSWRRRPPLRVGHPLVWAPAVQGARGLGWLVMPRC